MNEHIKKVIEYEYAQTDTSKRYLILYSNLQVVVSHFHISKSKNTNLNVYSIIATF